MNTVACYRRTGGSDDSNATPRMCNTAVQEPIGNEVSRSWPRGDAPPAAHRPKTTPVGRRIKRSETNESWRRKGL